MKKTDLDYLEKVCWQIYPKQISWKNLSQASKVWKFAEKNRLHTALAFVLPKSNQLVAKLRLEYGTYQSQVKSSLYSLRKLLQLHDFAVIKTFSSYPHLTHDLDVVVDPDIDLSSLENKLMVSKLREVEIDLHSKVSWTGKSEVSDDFFWKHLQEFEFGGVKIQVPDATLDVLIRIAHLPFEVGFIRFGELLHIYHQLQLVDRSILEIEAKSCGWHLTYQQMMKVLDNLHEKIFDQSELDMKISFPYHLPVGLLGLAVVEKRAWKKIWGARYVIRDRLGL